MSLTKFAAIFCMFFFVASCGDRKEAPGSGSVDSARTASVLRLAVTTSTRDSGLLEALIPAFEATEGIRVDVIAVGTGAALQQGRDGNVDAVIVHSHDDEIEFMRAGHGSRREDLMSNSFVLLGPPDDPAEIAQLSPSEALRAIARSGQRFVSRGDRSGTHVRELALWKALGPRPDWDGYVESGQGMGATLTMCDQMQGYTLADRGTFLARASGLDLIPLSGASDALRNPYGVITINPTKHPSIQGELANRFVDYLISPTAQALIANYRVAGEALFLPAHPVQ